MFLDTITKIETQKKVDLTKMTNNDKNKRESMEYAIFFP